jgi:predicted enzyme related to lactoylglutathione lyase
MPVSVERVIRRTLASVLLLVASAGLAAADPGSVVWHDLVTEDTNAARTFYGSLFGWTFEKNDSGATMVRHRGQPIAGISQVPAGGEPTQRSKWLVGIEVVRVADALDAASLHGATIHLETTRTPGFGRFAVLTDPQGAVVLLVQPEGSLATTSGPGSWLWNELWTRNTEVAAAFYAKVVGFDLIRQQTPDGVRLALGTNEIPRAGLVDLPEDLENARPAWLPYVAVADLATSLEQVRELGGTVVLESGARAGGSYALIADPGGAELFVYQLP